MQNVQTTLPVGSIVSERYRVEDLLGKGGFGAVYLVSDLRVRQNVFALKEIIDTYQRERRRFTLEGDLLKRTYHPSLPRVYRTFDDPAQGRAYILMDYIEGHNLEKLRRQQPGKRFSLGEALALMAPVVEAVVYLHAQEPPIIHRDIKPSNIIAQDSGERTMLVDFGIAKEFDQEATTTVIRHASPGYGAPEQYSTGTDTRTDIYGMGATLYTLLTGTPPVDAFFRMTQEMGKHTDPLPTVKELIPELPDFVSATISRAMALEKTERFASMEDFWQALRPEAELQPLPIPVGASVSSADLTPSVTYAPIAKPARSSSRARWLIMALLVTLALGIGFASAFFLLPAQRAQQKTTATTTPTIAVTHAATATATPTPTPTPSPTATATPTPTPSPTPSPAPSIPSLASAYAGSLHDNHGNIDTTMALQGITQNGQQIQGTFQVDQPLNGNGPFTGTVTSKSAIKFTVHSSDSGASAPLFFTGFIQQNGAMSGQYCSLNSAGSCDPNVGGYGTWSVQANNG